MIKMLHELITKIVNEAIEKRTITTTPQVIPVGYNPIETLRGALFHWIAVPFNNQEVWCQLRCPNALQLELCGDVSNIILDKYKDLKAGEAPKYKREEILKIKNYQEELCKVVFNIPTFDNIASLVGLDDFIVSEKRKELEQIREKLEAHKKEMSEAEKITLNEQIKKVEVQIGYILPDDTMAFITEWAMGNDVSEIQKITKGKFLRAASMAKLHGKAPSDYLSGVFTDFNRHEIDAYAAMVLDEHIKEHESVEKDKNQWFGRGKKK